MNEQTLYKVLVDGRACHGGDLAWSLPTDNGDGTYAAGAWHEVLGTIRVCVRGLHLTSDPMRWARIGMQVYRAEGEGDRDDEGDDKIAFRRARLIAPAPEAIPDWWAAVEAFVAELPTMPWMHPDGNPDPAWRLFSTRDSAWASARASARDSALDSAGASARASAGASARASALDSAWASAWDSAWASARAGARASALDSARASALDSAWDSARASARASALDSARDSARAGARASALWAAMLVCDGLPVPDEHRAHARARMEVWRKGYGLFCDVDGVLFVYERIA